MLCHDGAYVACVGAALVLSVLGASVVCWRVACQFGCWLAGWLVLLCLALGRSARRVGERRLTLVDR